jgi:3-oxoacid CoA-transferase subunit B
MEHVNKHGAPKVLRRCTLPLTGRGVVDRIITDRATFDVTPRGLVLVELAPGHTVEDVRATTEPEVLVSLPLREAVAG